LALDTIAVVLENDIFPECAAELSSIILMASSRNHALSRALPIGIPATKGNKNDRIDDFRRLDHGGECCAAGQSGGSA
jgi:hypothetical protein